MIRGLAHRAGISIAFLVVAVFATAVAGVGPSYYAAAKASILHDSFAGALVVQRGVEVAQQGDVANRVNALQQSVNSVISESMPDATERARVFAAPIQAEEASAAITTLIDAPLVWRTDFCANLRMASGRCATDTASVVVSSSLAVSAGLHVGQLLRPPGWPALTVTGVYAVPDFTGDYWFGRGATYFPVEDPTAGTPRPGHGGPNVYDAMFTPRATIDGSTEHAQGTAVIDQLVAGGQLRASDLDPLAQVMTALPVQVETMDATAVTSLPDFAAGIHASWGSLSIPVVLIVVQVLLLVWLVMFFVVRDGVDARGGEIALARLRGRRGPRLIGFALSEPLVLLAAAVPLGALLGPVGATLLARSLLRPGTPVGLPVLTWIAVAVATAGGLIAVVIAGSRTIRRPVVDQWQTTARDAGRRGWTFDAIVGTAAVAAIVELEVSGSIDSVRSGTLGFLVPGLIGLVAAVLVSRLVPLLCRASFRLTRRRGGLAAFLAVRQVARRAISVRTVFVLAIAFALAGFAVIGWSSGQSDRRFVGQVGVGAPVVMTVRPAAGVDLGGLVDRLDPGGRAAAVVDSAADVTADNQILLAVDPSRFAAVAAWRPDFASQSLPALMRQLTPPVAPPVELTGSKVRVQLRATHVPSSGISLAADIQSSEGNGAIYTPLGSVQPVAGVQTLTAALGACPCRLRDLSVSPNVNSQSSTDTVDHVQVSIQRVEVLGSGGWQPLPAAQRASQWRVDSDASVNATAGTLVWNFPLASNQTANLVVADAPEQLPALVTNGVHGPAPFSAAGLDADPLPVRPIAAVAAVPGASNGGLIVDRTFAERAANGLFSSFVAQQVWTTAGAAPAIEAGLRAANVTVVDTQTAAAQIALYDRQGPGLASVAFLAAASAAAVLGAAGALMGLLSTARRRRFEYAALTVAGASRRTLFAGLLIEQVIVIVAGVGAGALGGIVAADLAVRSLPQFVTPPVGVPLPDDLSLAGLGVFLAVAGAVLAVALVAAVFLVVARARADELRGGQP